MKKDKTKKRKLLPIILISVVALIVAGLWVMAVGIYSDNFGKRFESYKPLMLKTEDFDGLERVKYTFPSDKGQMLTGYMYHVGEGQKGIIVLAHGLGGGGHNSYMDVIDCFAEHGYYVFAYDATGNDESEGEELGGLPQGVVDLDHAITFVENNESFSELPIGLFGHSWGGYSVCNVLRFHPEIRAVISCSGFNSSADMFEAEGKKQAGAAIYPFMPFVKLHELIKYGKYASGSAMKSFAETEMPVLILHSADDDTVPCEYGYDMYYEKYGNDGRFEFIRLEDRGHNYVYDDMSYINEFNAKFDKWRDALDYDYKTDKERFAADKAAYINKNLDRYRWSHMLDGNIFDDFLKFYEKHMGTRQFSEKTAKVYEYLMDNFGKVMLSCQQESTWMGSPEYEMDYLEKTTGRLPAMRGLDFMNNDFLGVVKRAEEWDKKGGIVTICWHTGVKSSGYEESKNDDPDFSKLLTEGTDEYNELMKSWNLAAKSLQKLRDANVPVLWRPFHEFDGKWFWWGKGGSEEFKKLWRLMYDKFTNEYGLDNLIWVLGYSDKMKDGWYPGDQYVDIIGSDIYDGSTNLKAWKKLDDISYKPRAFHECGNVPSVETFEKDGDIWSWFMIWHTDWLMQNDPENLKNVYNSEKVITLDELPEF